MMAVQPTIEIDNAPSSTFGSPRLLTPGSNSVFSPDFSHFGAARQLVIPVSETPLLNLALTPTSCSHFDFSLRIHTLILTS